MTAAPATAVVRTRRVAWHLAIAALAMGGCATTTTLAADDAVQLEDGRTRFTAYTEREQGPVFHAVEGVDVRFYVEGREVASAQSDGRGIATVAIDLDEVEARFEARATVDRKQLRDAGKVVHWRRDRTLVACDIDATISETSLVGVFLAEADDRSKPIAGSVEALNEIAWDYDLVYFTARPRYTLERTQDWLDAHGYPYAPVFTALALEDTLAQANYKKREIGRLREMFPELLVGIGNSSIDTHGYGANGMLALIVNREDDTRYDSHVIEFRDWPALVSFFQVNRSVLQNPVTAAAVAAGDGMVLVPTIPWRTSPEPE
jgi:hypothetical protein